MSRRVQERHIHIIPCKPRLLGKNRDSALFLQFICVQERIALVHPPQMADHATRIEHRL